MLQREPPEQQVGKPSSSRGGGRPARGPPQVVGIGIDPDHQQAGVGGGEAAGVGAVTRADVDGDRAVARRQLRQGSIVDPVALPAHDQVHADSVARP
jgi:hypothetical protein